MLVRISNHDRAAAKHAVSVAFGRGVEGEVPVLIMTTNFELQVVFLAPSCTILKVKSGAVGIGVVGLVLAVFGFSMSGVWVRWLVALDPFSLTGWRVLIALVLLVPLALRTVADRRAAKVFLRSRRTHMAALRMTAFFVIAVVGFQQAPVALVLLCLGLSPAWVLLIERLCGRTTSAQQVIGVGLALAGAAVGLAPTMLDWLSGGAEAQAAGVGALCGLAAGVLSASYAVERQRLRGPQGEVPSAFLLAGLTSFWGLGMFAVGAATRTGTQVPSNTGETLALLGFGILSTAAPLWGFSAASRSLPPLLVALTTPVIPFGGALAAWILLGQVPPLAFGLGAPLVLAGIVIVLVAPQRSTSTAG